MIKPRWLLLAICLLVTAERPSAAAEGFALPKWLSLNPKKDSKAVPAYKKSSKQKIDGRTVNGNREKKSMISTVAGAPKKLMSGTRSMLTPTKKTTEKSHSKVTTASSRKAKAQKNAARKAGAAKQKPGWFKSLFTPEEPQAPQSIGEWMSLTRNDL